jgi:phage terminase large subunit
MPIPFAFDFKQPNYLEAFEWRMKRLNRIRSDPSVLPAMKEFYRDNPAQFITDWGVTYDPRNAERGLPTLVPFLLFPRQEEWVTWFLDRWKSQEDGITEKTRDMGMSWLTMAMSCTVCLFNRQVAVGCGSRKEEYVDVLGDPDSLFEKARIFLQNLPIEFRGGWDRKQNASYMKLQFPESGSILSGEAGDGIGRGGRASFYIVDESAFLSRPQLVDASLSQTTNCRQDVSTPNGRANSFAERRHNGKIKVFTFHWRDDPRKDQAWYDKQVGRLDPVTIAQEIDIDYSASVEGVLIPSAWVQAAIDADKKLGITITGSLSGALDVADEGIDLNAFGVARGARIEHLEAWSGKGDDIFGTVQRAFRLCDEHEVGAFHYDADGLGAGVRGDARVINEGRVSRGHSQLRVDPFRGSGAVSNPEGEMVKERKNKDFFANAKAQAWWSLRMRFQQTYRAVVEGMAYLPDDLIVIPGDLPERVKLVSELSQPTYTINGVGKVVVDKAPDGSRSPNHADTVMILFHPGKRGLSIWSALAA